MPLPSTRLKPKRSKAVLQFPEGTDIDPRPTSVSTSKTFDLTGDTPLEYSGSVVYPGLSVKIVGTGVTGLPIVTFEGSPDGVSWVGIVLRRMDTGAWSSTASVITGTRVFQSGALAGFPRFRVRLSTTGTGGTAIVVITLSDQHSRLPEFSIDSQAISPDTAGLAALGSDGVFLRFVRIKNSDPAITDYGLEVRIVGAGDNSVNSVSKLPTLPARANASVPAWTEGNQVPLSATLAGLLRVDSLSKTIGPFVRENFLTPASPTWRLAAPVTAPAAGGALITVAAVAGQIHRVFGVMASQETETVDNLVELREGATVRTGWGVTGTQVAIVFPSPLLVAAVNTAVSLNSRNAPGAGIDVVGALLVETAA